MRQFSILVVFALAFGGAAVLYEQESRKVKGVLTQITDLQAKMGDMQAEIKRLNAELEAVKLSERRRPNLNTIAKRVLNERADDNALRASQGGTRVEAGDQKTREFSAGDVTATAPAIHSRGEEGEDPEWSRPTVDAEAYQAQSAESAAQPATDPYQ